MSCHQSQGKKNDGRKKERHQHLEALRILYRVVLLLVECTERERKKSWRPKIQYV
jgi:hypothetical protein